MPRGEFTEDGKIILCVIIRVVNTYIRRTYVNIVNKQYESKSRIKINKHNEQIKTTTPIASYTSMA